MSIEDRVNPHIRNLRPYEPGKPIEEVERELGISGSIKLASNENPLGPSPRALQAMNAAAKAVNRYPDGACFALRARLAEKLQIPGNHLIFGSGGDEILELLAKTFLLTGDRVIMPWPSFAMYPLVAQGMGAEPVRVPLTADMQHDFPALTREVAVGAKMVFLCNPNNPTGTSFGAGELADFVSGIPDDVILVIDEAYYEFVAREDFPDTVALIADRPGTLALRTFSKIYGLAGLRVGYGISSPELVGFLDRARHPFNVNSLAEAAALAACDDDEHARRTHAMNRSGIDFLTGELEALGYRVWPSDANFLLAETGPGYYDALLRRGVIVRPLAGFGLENHIRISVGTPEENEILVKALQEIEQAGQQHGGGRE
ncbi:MAG: histidinol-phosphate transaminase [Myxococcota bacterium]|jgi:histidinol-phosphate aminotransferase|nr:histidinol-phosphate transaminase [Myxococcota bacterium]